ncbi:tryptophan synthase subunit beta [Oleidesulfovibrio alaskensis]|jgi:tryptophan synthase beta chain|uniref:tryptophan synthase subunit beta n=1 Tax=Oleidesulfovibrio alaskensis TaxID=58180 RepID=UPI0003F6D9BF|nr:tryptophan synthase subunit beta [Oleidesulfovibrio alaskensis]MBG0774324.1 tryptophan synthase subunit beta [Oleidesulfovibrio alaskensis]MBL3583513.1 tryptophan synthase subunit beta [Oleidesulfovibrio alaskensis]
MTSVPSADGFFGAYGGQYVPDSLKPILDELAATFERYRNDPGFLEEFNYYLTRYSGRETPLYLCANLTRRLGGAKIYLKREDLNHLGAHKVNNTIGQILLAKRMGKKKIIAETGAGQHGVATAATAALMGMECTIYMGAEDVERQKLNVFRMQMMGARVVPATSGQQTLKEAVDEALAAWIREADTTFYLLGSAVGPHPFPLMVREFQSVIGRELRAQMLEAEGRLPDYCIACVGGGSNAIGMFSGFINDDGVRLVGVEPAGRGLEYGDHAATLCLGEPGVMHGFNSYMLKDQAGEPAAVYSISAGLDYPGVGPEHSHLKDLGRAEYVNASDAEALSAFFDLSRTEGIIPALESAHALAYAMRLAPTLSSDKIIAVNLSGRGDKDVAQVERMVREGLVTP